MKPSKLAILLLMSLGAGTARAEVTRGTLTKVQGRVWVQAFNTTEAPASQGSAVPAGARIRTAADAMAEVTFEDGTLLQVQGGSSVQLSKSKREVKKSSIVLFFGRLWSKVATSSSGDTNYEVKTPNAVCGVRGTEFTTTVADDGTARVQVDAGKVAVKGDGDETPVSPGQQVDADENGVGTNAPKQSGAQDKAWAQARQERFKNNSADIVAKIKNKIMSRRDKLTALRSEEKRLQSKQHGLASQAQGGDAAALDALREVNGQLAQVADAIADLGDEADSQFGLVDHFADLANDPKFAGIDRKTLEAEAKSLRRIKADFDKMVADGTDISVEAMDKMMKDFHNGKGGGLKDKKGSIKDEMFDNGEMR